MLVNFNIIRDKQLYYHLKIFKFQIICILKSYTIYEFNYEQNINK